MRVGNMITILLSVSLSIGAALLVNSRTVSASPDVLQGRALELTDSAGKVRIRITGGNAANKDKPEITLLDEGGRPSALLSTDGRGQSTLYFNSPDKEGKVALGYIWGSDVHPEGSDPLAIWGMRVLGRDGQNEAVGIGSDGRLVQRSR